MHAMSTDHEIESSTTDAGDRPPPRWLGVAAAAVGVAVVTAGLTLVPRGDGPSAVNVEPLPHASPSTAVGEPPTTITPPLPAPLDDASRLQLDRIGRVHVGMTLDEASAAAGTPVTIVPGSNAPGTGRCAHAVAQSGFEGVQFMLVDGRIVRIEVGHGPVATLEGIGTGSTVHDVLTAYSGRIRVEPHTYTARSGGQYLIHETEGANGLSMLFETDGSRVTTFRSGFTGAVMAPEGCA